MPRTPAPTAALLASPDDTEAQFYDALHSGDLERMMAVWADDDEIVCVHPGGPRIVGLAAVRASFEALFAHGGVPARPEQVRRLQALGCAVHHLVERIVLREPQGGKAAWVVATNVYIKTSAVWRLAAHHASPGVLGEQPEAVTAPRAGTLH
jgi:uncharacterized protein (TIGR02246 family)